MRFFLQNLACFICLSAAALFGQAQYIDLAPIDWEEYDYIPGHQMIFFDNFTGDRVGESPIAWNISEQGKVDVLAFENRLWLHTVDETTMSPIDLKLAEKFTVEMDFYVLKNGYSSRYRIDLIGGNEDDWASFTLEPPSIFFSRSTGLTSEKFIELQTGTHHFALQVDGGGFVCYIDNRKIISIPKADAFKASRLELFAPGADEEDENDDKSLFTNFTVALGPADMQNQLRASGKIVAYGIKFAPTTANILPESTPTIKELVELLEADASLNISIECHDNELEEQNDNVKLSQNRAEAIKDLLVEKYKIPSDRINTEGWGETRPLADPNTVDGQMMNQRVEIIRK